MSAKMNSRVVLLVVFTSVAALFLPSVSAGGYYCKRCPLQPTAACNMSSLDDDCGTTKPCYAVTVQLLNGTLLSARGCYSGPEGSCNSTACEQIRNQTGGVVKHCIADCCTDGRPDGQRCNTIVPAADFMSPPTLSSSPSVPVAIVSSIGGTTATDKPPAPTSSSTMKKGLRYLLVLLPSVIFILN